MRADNLKSSPGTKVIEAAAVLFYLLTSLPTLALFCALAAWDWATGNTDESHE